MGDIYEQYQVAQWRASYNSPTYAFPAVSIDEDGGNRLIERERAYRWGCKIDDTGSKAKYWTIETVFNNSIDEPGIAAVNGSVVLYPELVNSLIDLFDLYHDEASDLYVPTRGWVRARLRDYKRRESPDEQDTARVTMVFAQDNEDRINANSFSYPSINANAIRLSNETTFDSQSEGVWSDDSQSLGELAAGLESWANAPDDFMLEIEQRASATMGAVDRIIAAFSKPAHGAVSTTGLKAGRSGRDNFRSPESSTTVVKLHAIKETAARGKHTASSGKPRLMTVVFERPQSLITIAAMLGQSLDALIDVNSQLDDPFWIPAKTPVRVYEQTH